MLNRRRILTLMAMAAAAPKAVAHSFKIGEIAIGHVWGLPSDMRETQVFVPLSNRGQTKDELVAARSPICSMIELRQNNRYDDPPLTSIAVEPAKPVAMRKGARHLRLIGLSRPLKSGDKFDMTLDFLNAGEITVEVIVEDGSGH
ncbi:copper chaperone PCu(A)C [Nordella sp. HKS 07]|uniref:copper chaperone PCu(A)C n=1 Tax=Nordella sp. HKS 07 TaxID=2712222 RepID=UPI0013E1296D|nr:copper chaperone PCu(A)C [Nordella sp. HKS 07]QIG47016.1 copper chaperone PCu(A)C [Nordella sp. HKS 07]